MARWCISFSAYLVSPGGLSVHLPMTFCCPLGSVTTEVSKEKRIDTGEKRGRLCEVANKAAKNALEEELIAEMYEMIL